MVALNTAYASSKTLERSQNRVGDFFTRLPIASGQIDSQGATAPGKTGLPLR